MFWQNVKLCNTKAELVQTIAADAEKFQKGWIFFILPAFRWDCMTNIMYEVERFLQKIGRNDCFETFFAPTFATAHAINVSALNEDELTEMIELLEKLGVDGIENIFRAAKITGRGFAMSFFPLTSPWGTDRCEVEIEVALHPEIEKYLKRRMNE